jgi:hypothetical protein
MAFDEHRRVTVLHGGFAAGVVGDTWEWDGSDWFQRSDVTSHRRADHAMAYARDRRTTFLVGGISSVAGAPRIDMWEWDGNSWQAASAAPVGVRGHALVHDRARGALVLFGGVGAPVMTWEFATCGDPDGDGVIDPDDECDNSDLRSTVIIDGCDSRVGNHLFDDGCTMADHIAACVEEADNHGALVGCVGALTNTWMQDEIITSRDKGPIQRCAAHASLPQHGEDSARRTKGSPIAPVDALSKP